MERERSDGQWVREVFGVHRYSGNQLAVESYACYADELPGRKVQADDQPALGTNDVGELREHEGGRGYEIGCLRNGGEQLGEAFSTYLRAGGYRCALTLRVVQVAALDLHFRTASFRAPLHRPR